MPIHRSQIHMDELKRMNDALGNQLLESIEQFGNFLEERGGSPSGGNIPKCIEAQQLTGHLGVKHCFGAGRESGTKSRQTLNTRYDPDGSRSASETMGDKLHRQEGNNPDH
ncbi:hypothetical protein KIW84_014494 [Lathyrus oleraceus]|uniref:Uncharacterized protein n=1 Tax=Pisum sativum TaxID=3888 RepID=A0A9D5BMT0_PEA|nr:hypothetical protein KIW84_014494 [Pisum sativum]